MRQEILNKLRELQKTVEQFDETKYKRNVGHLKVELKYRYNKLIDKLIEDYRPSLLEKPTSGFEDIFNSF